MLSIKTNIGAVTESIRKKLALLSDKEYLPRTLAFDTIDLMTKRIHIDGKDASDSEIGTYNKSYLKLRERKYNRSSDPKIIVSLTRQLENNYAVFPLENGYGVGFLNPFNLQKARWVEENKNKKIFSLSPSELRVIGEIIQDNVSDVLK